MSENTESSAAATLKARVENLEKAVKELAEVIDDEYGTEALEKLK